MKNTKLRTPLIGVALVVVYTAAVTVSDAFTKHLTQGFEAPQILAICSATVLMIILLNEFTGAKSVSASDRDHKSNGLKTTCAGPMVLRSVMTVAATVLFFYAFALLPFAEVFLYIACVPLLVGVLSQPILGERVSRLAWLAVIVGSFGVFLLFPARADAQSLGHLVAFSAALCGTIAILMARYIAREEDNPMALVFYPQLAVLVSMSVISPFVWSPISLPQVLLAMACGVALFVARYSLARAMRLLPAYMACGLMNLQFVWMVLVGVVVFHEVPALNTLAGACVIIMSGLFLVYEQHTRSQKQPVKVQSITPAKAGPQKVTTVQSRAA